MAFALIAFTGRVAGVNGATTTPGINTAGADLIIIQISRQAGVGGTPTDSKTNTWTPLDASTTSGGGTETRCWYCVSPNVGSGHTFSTGVGAGQYSCINVLAFSGVDTASPFLSSSGTNTSGGSTLQNPGITGTASLFVIGFNGQPGAGASTIDSSFIIETGLSQAGAGSNNYAGAFAYKLSNTGSISPTWTYTGSQPAATGMYAFNPSVGTTNLTATISDTQTFTDSVATALFGFITSNLNDTITFSELFESQLGLPLINAVLSDTQTFNDFIEILVGNPLITNSFADTITLSDAIVTSLNTVISGDFNRVDIKLKVTNFFQNPAYYLGADLNDSIQDGTDEITAFSGCNYGVALIPFVGSLSYYDLLTLIPNYIGVIAIFNGATKCWMTPTSVRKLDQYRPDWETAIGTPEFFVPINHRYIAICKKPLVQDYGNMYMLYVSSSPVLDDATTLPFPSEYAQLIEAYVKTDLWEQNEEFTKASKEFLIYQQQLQKLHTLVHSKRQIDRLPSL